MALEDVKRGLARVFKREVSAQHFDRNMSFSQVKDALRQFTKSKDLEGVINTLLESDLVVEKKRAAIAAELTARLRKQYPHLKNFSVILLGSGAHGGAEVRRLLENNENRPDFDWALCADNDEIQDYFFREKIKDFADPMITQLGEKHGLGQDFESCGAYNGKNYAVKNLDSAQAALDFILSPGVSSDPLDDCLFFFGGPSFPSEINERNRGFVIDALRALAQKDRQRWERVVKKLLGKWEKIHGINEKHIAKPKRYTAESEKKSLKLMEERTAELNEIMQEPFRRLILSTGD